MLLRVVTAGLVLVALLSACSGGGTSLPASVPTAAPRGPQRITFNIKIPAPPTGGSALRRRPAYISTNTQSALIAINGGTPLLIDLSPTSPNCTTGQGGRTCSLAISAPVGYDTFSEALYATTNGTGPVLSQSTTFATIVAGQANVVTIVLDGVIATLSVGLEIPSPPVGSPVNIGVTVNFYDASGAAIVGSDPFVNSVTLSDSDGSGITKLSKPSLASPADAVNLTLAYNGQPLTQAVISASATGVATATATLTPQNTKPVVFNDYPMFGYDSQHDEFNPASTAITPTSVSGLHLAWQSLMHNQGDFNVQSQPILATEIPNHVGVLYVAGGSGHVDAIDALTGGNIWTNPTGQMSYTCPGDPQTIVFGAAGTVAYDSATRSLYSVANTNSALNAPTAINLLHLDGTAGTTLGSYNFGAYISNNEINFGHTAVTINNGIAYVGTGSTCDIPSWRGRVAAIQVPSMTSLATYFPVYNPPNAPYGGGGIWGWGGVTADFHTNIYTGVGNADNSASGIQPPFIQAPQEYSGNAESFLKLTGDLSTVIAANHPIPPSLYGGNAADLDLNGTPAVFQPMGCDSYAALQGKSGALYIYDTAYIGNGPIAQYQMSPPSYEDGFLGSPAYSSATGLIYADVASSVSPNLFSPGMIAINPGCGSPAVTWHAAFGPDSSGLGVPRSVPSVSAGGVVFAATTCNVTSGPCTSPGEYGALYMLDASNGTVLNNGLPVLYATGNIRAPATIDGKWVFVADINGNIYGLTIDSSYPTVPVHYGRQPSGFKRSYRVSR